MVRGGIRDVVLYDQSLEDKRILSGRTLILPQPVLALQTLVAQIIANMSDSELASAGVSRDQVVDLKNSIHQLALISAPLSGFHGHLATRALGNHVKANNRLSANELELIVQAVREGAGFTEDALKAMLTETNPTPYGFLVDFTSSDYCPFKSAVHGQFKFTKINIIDKFRQAIHAIDPTPGSVDILLLLVRGSLRCIHAYPISMSHRLLGMMASKLRTRLYRIKMASADMSKYHLINQAVRFNGALVTLHKSKEYWCPADGVNPVWGWVVANRADNGLQFLLEDGTFYCEVQLGGPDGARRHYYRLRLQICRDGRTGIGKPASRAEFLSNYLNAAIGKPLALVNMAWSLELVIPEYVNQASLNNSRANPESLRDHSWKVKLGDRQRAFDGLIAYFCEADRSKQDHDGLSFDFDKFYTYYYNESQDKNSDASDDEES
ncbi:hypothetical protein AJ80_09203 [Polytolypa hystricis UAMH7299]|uniref:Uncharacterized protein n=1 Tax=Polytolypa hystricis (strain UAMH7299) TaxID=1447883 RepID=A0A2B7WU34_POLH7|nr:hypothetical protein AJ80_09203 [Polytolypa hystricis UAMH7299]